MTDDETRDVSLYVPTITCKHCKAAILEGLRDVQGVRAASVEIDSKTVLVTLGQDAPLRDVVESIEARDHKVAMTSE